MVFEFRTFSILLPWPPYPIFPKFLPRLETKKKNKKNYVLKNSSSKD